MQEKPLEILLVEDDEDDYALVRDLLREILPSGHSLHWASRYDTALRQIERSCFDVILLDYRLDNHDGLEFLMEASSMECCTPIIFLTGEGNIDVDIRAMKAGAVDYLIKGQISGAMLERSIRYAIDRKRAECALRESEKQLRFLSARLLSLQEEERTRLAQEIHDSIGQSLAAVKFGIEAALNVAGPNRARNMTRYLESVIPVVQDTIEGARNIYMGLRPTVLDDFGIIAALGWLAREFTKAHEIIRVRQTFEAEESEIPPSLRVIIFRIVQEAFDNVARHSGATRVEVVLTRTEGLLELDVMDNGFGFDLKRALSGDHARRGLGISSMKERAKLSGGSFRIEAGMDRGTRISVAWPCSFSVDEITA